MKRRARLASLAALGVVPAPGRYLFRLAAVNVPAGARLGAGTTLWASVGPEGVTWKVVGS